MGAPATSGTEGLVMLGRVENAGGRPTAWRGSSSWASQRPAARRTWWGPGDPRCRGVHRVGPAATTSDAEDAVCVWGRGEVEVVKEVIVEEAAPGGLGLKEEEMVEEQEMLEEEDAAPEIEIVPIDP